MMSSKSMWVVAGGLIVVACTTNTTVVQGGRAGGSACDYDSECTSNTCTGGKGAAPPASGSTSSGGENGAGPSGESMRPLGTCAVSTTTSSGSSSGGSSGGASSPSDAGTATSCMRFPVGDSRNTCADCTKLDPAYQCTYWNDDVPYCYFPCETDSDCACDPYAPYCRPSAIQHSLSTNVGTICSKNP